MTTENTNTTSIVVHGTTIVGKRHDLDYNGDGITMYEIASSESDDCEDIIDWIPKYLIQDFIDGSTLAKKAIEDYIAGWDFM